MKVWDHLKKLSRPKSMGPAELCSRILRGLADVVAKTTSSYSKSQGSQANSLVTEKKETSPPFLKRGENKM